MKLQHFEKMEEKELLKSFSNDFIQARKNLQISPIQIKKLFFYLQMCFGTFLFTYK